MSGQPPSAAPHRAAGRRASGRPAPRTGRAPRARRLLAVVLAGAVMTAGLLGGVGWAALRFATAPVAGPEPYTLLVLGSDTGPLRGGSALRGRADAIHLVVVSRTHRQVTILAVPRDTLAPVPGRGTTKINAALTRGPDAAAAAVEALTGIEVDDWILTSFTGFQAGIDAVGGVTVEVEERIYDPRVHSKPLPAGRQRLSGWEALTYARVRKTRAGGDFARAGSQARLLAALHRRFAREGPSLARVAELARILSRHTATSITPDRLFRLAGLALTLPPEAVRMQVLPGHVGSRGRASVVRLTQQAQAILADVRDDGVLGAASPATPGAP